MELALKHSKERKGFGSEICNHRAIAFKLADLHTEIEAVQIHGGNGFVKEYHVDRMTGDAKITQISEGLWKLKKL